MDVSSYMASALSSLQSSIGTFALQKAMGNDAQSMATLLEDMKTAVPAPKVGSIDLRV